MAFSSRTFPSDRKDKVPNAPASGIAAIPLEILGIIDVGEIQFPKSGYYYGPRRPDFSVIHVKMRELPCVELLSDFSHLRVGDEVASLGYPMGADLLTAPGWLHQLGPTLQRGIISAILPFPCKAPHSVLIDIMSLGGASGSPVFLANEPRIIGVLFAGLEESQVIFTPGQDETLQPVGMTKAATSLSYVVPAYYVAALLEKVQQNPISKLPPNTKTLNETLQEIEFVVRKTPGKHNEPPRPGKATTPELAEGIEGFVNISYLDEEEKL
jgi:hypothetical protein